MIYIPFIIQLLITTLTHSLKHVTSSTCMRFLCLAINTNVFLCPATKSGGILCYTLRSFECLSVGLSVRPSAVDHSCPLHNFDPVRDNFTKLGTNIKHDQTT